MCDLWPQIRRKLTSARQRGSLSLATRPRSRNEWVRNKTGTTEHARARGWARQPAAVRGCPDSSAATHDSARKPVVAELQAMGHGKLRTCRRRPRRAPNRTQPRSLNAPRLSISQCVHMPSLVMAACLGGPRRPKITKRLTWTQPKSCSPRGPDNFVELRACPQVPEILPSNCRTKQDKLLREHAWLISHIAQRRPDPVRPGTLASPILSAYDRVDITTVPTRNGARIGKVGGGAKVAWPRDPAGATMALPLETKPARPPREHRQYEKHLSDCKPKKHTSI